MLRLAIAVLAAGVIAHAATLPADDNAFPHTKPFGRATVQYQDDRVQSVAIYDYSQSNHDTAWLLVQVGVALRERTAVRREHFHIVMPDGRVVALATQEQFVDDGARLRQFRQNARIFRKELGSYFPKSANGDALRFFALPGDGTIREQAVVAADHGVVMGDLYFKSPTLRWEPGTYRLVFDHEKGRAELPIRLD